MDYDLIMNKLEKVRGIIEDLKKSKFLFLTFLIERNRELIAQEIMLDVAKSLDLKLINSFSPSGSISIRTAELEENLKQLEDAVKSRKLGN